MPPHGQQQGIFYMHHATDSITQTQDFFAGFAVLFVAVGQYSLPFSKQTIMECIKDVFVCMHLCMCMCDCVHAFICLVKIKNKCEQHTE